MRFEALLLAASSISQEADPFSFFRESPTSF